MGYYIRILSKNLVAPPLKDLQRVAEPAVIECDEGTENEWDALTLKHKGGETIAFIEKNPVVPGKLGAEELQEFIDDVSHCKPASGAAWLKAYLPSIKVIYAFQLLQGTDIDNGYDCMHRVYNLLSAQCNGIAQADQEGFSNEVGHTILWQFSDTVSGDWNVGVLGLDGCWINFEMDLGNQQHREAFLCGEVPPGVNIVSKQ